MRHHRKRKRIRLIIFLLIIALCYIVINGTGDSSTGFSLLSIKNFLGIHQTATTENGWNLILVNREHYIPDDYEVELTELSNGEKIDSRIYPDLQAMFNDARASGLQLFVRDGYRTAETQQRILDEKIEAYRTEGYSALESEKLAKEWAMVPGTSEHQLGLAVDINADNSQSNSNEVYKWLENNSYRYGFINRYPSSKTEITGVIYEPWHYRYVGKEAAQAIYSQGICLEEYIEKLN